MTRAALFVLLLLLALLRPSWAAGDWQAALASGDYARMEEAVRQLAEEGGPDAAKVLEAFSAGRLYAANGALYIEGEGGTLSPLTAERAPSPPNAKRLRMNNALRREVEAALSALRLTAADRSTRLAAAEAAFHARDAALRPAIDKALAREADPEIAKVLGEAHAALVLADPHAAPGEARAAIARLAARGDEEALGILNTYRPADPDLAAALERAKAAIARRLAFWSALQQLYYGVSLGSVLLLAASGLAITFGVMGVINMAHGEMVMLGAYATSVVQQVLAQFAPSLMPASLVLAIPAAFLVCGLAGIAIERLVIRRLYGRPLETLLATAGISLILQEIVRNLFGASNREVITPGWMSGEIHLGGLSLTLNRLAIIVFSAIVFAALIGLLRFSFFGIKMRAVTQNRAMAAAMGIRTPRIDALTFGLGSAIAGLGGVALGQIDNVSPNLGQNYIIDSFLVVVFGGVGNLWGTALGAMVLGFVNKLLEPLAGAVLGKIALLVLVVIFIQWRPRGLFPLKGRAVEA
jgi:urea transport system permease protein